MTDFSSVRYSTTSPIIIDSWSLLKLRPSRMVFTCLHYWLQRTHLKIQSATGELNQEQEDVSLLPIHCDFNTIIILPWSSKLFKSADLYCYSGIGTSQNKNVQNHMSLTIVHIHGLGHKANSSLTQYLLWYFWHNFGKARLLSTVDQYVISCVKPVREFLDLLSLLCHRLPLLPWTILLCHIPSHVLSKLSLVAGLYASIHTHSQVFS